MQQCFSYDSTVCCGIAAFPSPELKFFNKVAQFLHFYCLNLPGIPFKHNKCITLDDLTWTHPISRALPVLLPVIHPAPPNQSLFTTALCRPHLAHYADDSSLPVPEVFKVQMSIPQLVD